MAQLGILHEAGTKLGVVTVSIGVAAGVPMAGGSLQSLIDLADAGLYKAKDGGRNGFASMDLAAA